MITSLFKVIYDTKTLQYEINSARDRRLSIGFVPTMGAIHKGHLKLVKECTKYNSLTVVSIYVNPTQFNNTIDLEKYPRTLDDDLAKLKDAGANIIFVPSDSEMYPGKKFNLLDFDLGNLENLLEGQFRPGHFAGMVTVVKALFDKVQPDDAYFGQKDYQQLLVIKKMVTHFNLPVSIHRVAIAREPDGLAISSRNMLLNPQERQLAPQIYATLIQAQKLLKVQPVKQVLQWAKNELSSDNLFKFEYFEVAEAETLKQVSELKNAKKVIILTAVWIGETRLIDNLMIN